MKRLAKLLLLISLCLTICGFHTPPKDKLLTALAESGCQFESYTVMGWVQVIKQPSSKGHMGILADQTLASLDVSSTSRVWTEAEGIVGLRCQGTNKLGDLVELYLQSSDLPQATGTYMVLSYKSEQELAQYHHSRGRVRRVLAAYHSEPTLSCTFDLSKQGKISVKNQRTLMKQIFSATKAKYVEGIETKDLLSWSGYSKYLPESLAVGQHKLNLNTAITYADTEAKTHVLVGTPVITSEY